MVLETINKQPVIIDLKKPSVLPTPNFVQNDSNIIQIEVKENGSPAELSNIGKIIANYKRPDHAVISRSLVVENDCVIYKLGQEEMKVPGYGELEIQFYNEDATERISTRRFKTYISGQIGTDEIKEESGEFSLLQELFAEVEKKKDEAESVVATIDGAMEGFTNRNIETVFTDGEVTRIDEKDGDILRIRTNFEYNHDGTVKKITKMVPGQTLVYTFNYSDGLITSVNKNLIEGGL